MFLPLFRQCREVHFSVLMLWSALGSLLIGCIGLYALGAGEEEQERVRDAREIPDIEAVNTTIILSVSTKYTIRIFEGSTEWLVATLVAFLGVLVSVAVIKVRRCKNNKLKQSRFSQAVQLVSPGKLVLLKCAELIAGYVLHLCIWGDSYQWLDLGGAVCVGLAVVFTGVEELIVDIKRWRWF